MAIFTPGPIINQIAGSIGGATFQRGPGAYMIHAKHGRIQRPSPVINDAQRLHRSAAHAWPLLSAAAQTQWTAIARTTFRPTRFGAPRPMSGRELHTASWLHQIGKTTPTAPSTPTAAGTPAPMTANARAYQSTLYISSLSRPRAADELPVIRVYKPQPPTQKNCRGRILRTLELASTNQLYEKADESVNISAFNSYAVCNSVLTTSSSKTIEFYYNITKPYPGPTCMLMNWANNLAGIMYNTSNFFYLFENPVLIYSAFFVVPSAWCYIAWTWNFTTMQHITYLNGTAGAPHAFTRIEGFPTGFRVGYNNSGSAATGLFDEIRISNTCRTPAQITATWNAGTLLHLANEADTVAIWNADNVTSATIPDVSGHNKPLTLVAGSMGPGFAAMPAAYTADNPSITERRTFLNCSPNAASNMGAQAKPSSTDW